MRRVLTESSLKRASVRHRVMTSVARATLLRVIIAGHQLEFIGVYQNGRAMRYSPNPNARNETWVRRVRLELLCTSVADFFL